MTLGDWALGIKENGQAVKYQCFAVVIKIQALHTFNGVLPSI